MLTPSLSLKAQAIEPSMIRMLRDKARSTSLDLGLGQTDLPVPDAARERLLELLASPLKAGYCPNLGLRPAREAVAARYGAQPEQIMITCGVQQALAVALLGLVNPGDEVLVPDPGFSAYANLVRMAGATPVYYELDAQDAWRLDPERVAAALSQCSRPRAIILSSPGNPTGAVHARSDLEQVLALCQQRGVLWISDEIYEDYLYDGHEHCSPWDFEEYRQGGVKASGLSKSHHMMGWRLGWLMGDAQLIEGLKGLHQHMVTSASTLSQEAAVASLAVHQQVIDHALPIFEHRRRLVEAQLSQIEGLRFWSGQGAFYLFLDIRAFMPNFQSTHHLSMCLLDEVDVVLIPGSGFGPSGEGYLRLAYTTDAQVLREATDRIAAFLLRP